MSYVLSPQLTEFVQAQVASGRYTSEEQVLSAALTLLAERERIVAAVKEGLEDVREGRTQDWDTADAEFRARHGIAAIDDEV